jgi:hypothetical protein
MFVRFSSRSRSNQKELPVPRPTLLALAGTRTIYKLDGAIANKVERGTSIIGGPTLLLGGTTDI